VSHTGEASGRSGSAGRVVLAVWRVGWRLAVFVLIFSFTLVALIALIDAMPSLTLASMPQETFGVIAAALSALFATHVMVRYVEHQSWSMVMLDRPALEPGGLGLGTLAGLLPIAIPSLLLFATGWLSPQDAPDGSWIAGAVAVTVFLVPAAFTEELIVRGYPFALVRRAAGVWTAIALTGVVFGVLHAANPGANAQSIAVVSLSGIFLGLVLIVTKSLYAATLCHAAWNWVMAVILHTPVSGTNLPAPDYRVVDSGPDWATGGTWGPEAGLPAALAMILLIPFLVKFGRGGHPVTFGLHRTASHRAPSESHG
jgi:membrane protease YdiL (CAAX protease family)